MNKNILAFGAHPDDVEFGCGGTLLLLKSLGYEITIIDLTKGEKSKYGANKRIIEAERARKILGMARIILDFGDKNITLTKNNKKTIENLIKKYNPEIIFAPYIKDKHPDHINTGKLLSPFTNTIHYFISDVENEKIGVNITSTYEKKNLALDAHETQIQPGDVEWTNERHQNYGKRLGVKWGELFYIKNEKMILPSIFKKL